MCEWTNTNAVALTWCSEWSEVKWTLLSRIRLFATWNSPGQNTGAGSCSLLQGILPTQGSSLGLPHSKRILYQLSHKGSPRILEWVAYPFSGRSSRPRNWTRVSCIPGDSLPTSLSGSPEGMRVLRAQEAKQHLSSHATGSNQENPKFFTAPLSTNSRSCQSLWSGRDVMWSSAFALSVCSNGSCYRMMPVLKDMDLCLPHPREAMAPVKWAEASEELSPFAEEAGAHSVKNSFRFNQFLF